MPLNGDGVDEVSTVGGGGRHTHELIGEHRIFRPTAFVAADIAHIFDGGEGVKAEIRENLVPVVERAGVIVHGVRRIAVIL